MNKRAFELKVVSNTEQMAFESKIKRVSNVDRIIAVSGIATQFSIGVLILAMERSLITLIVVLKSSIKKITTM